jgi:hypothetical protein
MPKLYIVRHPEDSDFDLFVRELSPTLAQYRWRQYYDLDLNAWSEKAVAMEVPEAEGKLGAVGWDEVKANEL